jgi:cytochrome c oxidase assembly protein subunit 11
VPLYNVICQITGIGGKVPLTAAQQSAEHVDTARLVTMEFLTNTNQYMPVEFHTEQARLEIHPGQQYRGLFYARNERDGAMVGQAVPNVAPGIAAAHLHKLECFCFNKQTLKPGERREMPVVFVIDPALPKDISTITLSYTFFEVEGNRRQSVVSGEKG